MKWWDNVKLSGTDINWNTLVGRPGTSTYAANFGSKYDELSIVVLDATGKISGTKNTVLEKFQNVSKSAGAQTTEGADNYYAHVLRFASEYIYYGKHDTANVDTAFTVVTPLASGVLTSRTVAPTQCWVTSLTPLLVDWTVTVLPLAI